MTTDEALALLMGEPVEVNASVFTDSPQLTLSDEWIRCEVRFLRNAKGQVGGWCDLAGDRLYVLPERGGPGGYVPVSLIRKLETSR